VKNAMLATPPIVSSQFWVMNLKGDIPPTWNSGIFFWNEFTERPCSITYHS